MTEEELITKYDRFISKHTRIYHSTTNMPPSAYEDLKSEATIAFLKCIRKIHLEDREDGKLTQIETFCIARTMRYNMRRYIWRSYGEKNVGRHPNHRRCKSFSDLGTTEEPFSLEQFDYADSSDDYADVDFRDMLDRLEPVERETADLLIRGYSFADVAKIRGTSRKNVTVTVGRIKKKISDVA